MKIIKSLAVSLLLAPLFVFAQSSTTELPSAGLTPENPLYFLDRLGENLQDFFTFKSEAKAKLQIEFAGERISEIKVLVERKGSHTKGIDKAKSLLLANVAYAAEIVDQEKASGKDVTGLAKDIDDQFDAREKLLTQTFLDARAKLLAEHIQIRTKLLAEAKASGDTAKVAELTQQLNDIQNQANDLQGKKDEIKTSLREEKKKIEQNMDQKDQHQDEVDQNNEDQQEQNQEGDQGEFELEQEGDQGDNESEQQGEHGTSEVEQNQKGEQGKSESEQKGQGNKSTSNNQTGSQTGTSTESQGSNNQEGE